MGSLGFVPFANSYCVSTLTTAYFKLQIGHHGARSWEELPEGKEGGGKAKLVKGNGMVTDEN